jgi:transposase-like protein
MNKKELEAFAKQAAKGIKSEQDLTDFRKILTKITVEAALNADLEEHLCYALHKQSNTKNSETAIPQSPFVLKMVKWHLKPRAIEKVVLSLS